MTADETRRDSPVLLILTGLPFAGKTTLGRELVDRLDNAVHVDMDQINTKRGLGIDATPISALEWSETYSIAYDRAETALSAGQDVVFDAANYSRAQRDILRQKGRRAGAESAVIFVDIKEEECRRRWHANRESGDHYDVRDEDFERVVERFDPPTGNERVLLYYPGMTADDLVTGLRQVFGR